MNAPPAAARARLRKETPLRWRGGVVNLADGGTRTLRVPHAVRRTNQGGLCPPNFLCLAGKPGKFPASKWSDMDGGGFSYAAHICKSFLS